MKNKSSKCVREANFNEAGKFKNGNVIGRMPKSGFNLHDLNKLVLEYEKSPENKKGALLKHYIKRLFKNDRLLAKYFDKNIPSKTELTGKDGEPISVTLREVVYKESGKPIKEDIEKSETL
jgi:hypothetical protein